MHDLHKLCERIEGKPRELSPLARLALLSGPTHEYIDIWSVSPYLKHGKRTFLFPLTFLGLYPPRAKLAIQKYLSQLTDNEQAEIFERVQVKVWLCFRESTHFA